MVFGWTSVSRTDARMCATLSPFIRIQTKSKASIPSTGHIQPPHSRHTHQLVLPFSFLLLDLCILFATCSCVPIVAHDDNVYALCVCKWLCDAPFTRVPERWIETGVAHVVVSFSLPSLARQSTSMIDRCEKLMDDHTTLIRMQCGGGRAGAYLPCLHTRRDTRKWKKLVSNYKISIFEKLLKKKFTIFLKQHGYPCRNPIL